MSSESDSGSVRLQRWADWWSRRRQAKARPAAERPSGIERRKSPHIPCCLAASCREISIFGADDWPAVVDNMSAGGLGLHLVQPFPPGTFLGILLKDDNGQPLARLLVKVVHASRPKDSRHWRLGCETVRHLPVD